MGRSVFLLDTWMATKVIQTAGSYQSCKIWVCSRMIECTTQVIQTLSDYNFLISINFKLSNFESITGFRRMIGTFLDASIYKGGNYYNGKESSESVWKGARIYFDLRTIGLLMEIRVKSNCNLDHLIHRTSQTTSQVWSTVNSQRYS